MTIGTKTKRGIKYTVKVLVPVVLLTIIFFRIDIRKLGENFLQVRAWYFLLALIVGYICQILLAALRWKLVLARFYSIRVPYLVLLKHFWIGMFVGYFVPAGLGVDAYRIASVGRITGFYGKNATAVLGEKLLGLFSSILLLMAVYPMIQGMIEEDGRITRIANYVYGIGAGLTVLVVLTLLFVRAGFAKQIVLAVERRLNSTIEGFLRKIGKSRSADSEHLGIVDLVKPFFQWKYFVGLILFTMVMRVVTALGGNIMFRALGIELPIVVNVFTICMLFMIFMLPISFGSLGVREGATIVLYGLFGIESETALTVSFLGLACLLLTVAIGGVILLVANIRQEHSVP